MYWGGYPDASWPPQYPPAPYLPPPYGYGPYGPYGALPYGIDPRMLARHQAQNAWMYYATPNNKNRHVTVNPRARSKDRKKQSYTVNDAAIHVVESADAKDREAKAKEVESKSQQRAQELVATMSAEGPERKKLIESALAHARKDEIESRAMQVALETLEEKGQSDDARDLAWGLKTHVEEAYKCKNANFLIEKIIIQMPGETANFVIEELLPTAVEAARHRYGCRILCRILEHMRGDKKSQLVENILIDVKSLIRHNFGFHVIEHIVEFGSQKQQSIVAEALLAELPDGAKYRNASYLIEKVLKFCSDDVQHKIIHKVQQHLQELATQKCGRYVVMELLKLPEGKSRPVVEELLPHLDKLTKDKCGCHVVVQLLKYTGQRSQAEVVRRLTQMHFSQTEPERLVTEELRQARARQGATESLAST